jgi:hypothetical protein
MSAQQGGGEPGPPDPSEFVVVSMPRREYLSGRALWRRQFSALFRKRALCALRDRPTSLAQVLAPVALVLLALWAGGATSRLPQQPPLHLDRHSAMAGRAAALGASPSARDAAGAFVDFTAGYPAPELRDTGAQAVLRLPYLQPLNGTLDGALLASWFDSPRRAYDGLFLEELPEAAGAVSATGGGGGAPRLPAQESVAFRYAVLVNQTAVHALPAALNQAHSALLRLVTGDPGAGIDATLHPLPAAAGDVDARVSELSGELISWERLCGRPWPCSARWLIPAMPRRTSLPHFLAVLLPHPEP